MFQKNMEALRVNNPVLAQKLEDIELSSIDKVHVYEAKNKDLIITYNETPLHSTVDPTREAQATWVRSVKTELNKSDIQIVFGLGLGYLFKRAYTNSNSKVFVYEPLIDVLRFVLEYVDLSKELADSRVFITNSEDELVKKISDDYLTGDRAEFLFLNGYASVAQEQLVSVTNKLIEIIENKQIDVSTIISKAKIWTKNSILNFKKFDKVRPLSLIKDKFANKPAMVIAAGPSLANDIELIKANKDKFVTIAVGKALQFLKANGVVPDFACFADSQYVENQLEGLDSYVNGINAVVATRADIVALKSNFKTNFVYFTDTDSIASWAASIVDDKSVAYKSSGTVTAIAYYTAKILGCTDVVFSGLDLAFTDGMTYAGSKELAPASEGKVKHSEAVFKYVKNVQGQEIPSRSDYALFIRQFEDIIEEDKNTVSFFNTALEGALIRGCDYKPLSEVIEIVAGEKLELQPVIDALYKDTQEKWANLDKSLSTELSKQKTELTKIADEATAVTSDLKSIIVMFEEREKNLSPLQQSIENVKDKLSNLRNAVVQNPFILNYVQNDILKYTQAYKTSILQSLDEVEFNTKLEHQFFELIAKTCGEILNWFEEAGI